MTPRTYRIELGINLYAATIPRTNPNLRLFPLQNALAEVTPGQGGEELLKPAWYTRLGSGDEMSFRLVDISGEPSPSYPDLALIELIFTDPRTGTPDNPFADPPVGWKISHSSRRKQCSPIYSREGQELTTWDIVGVDAGGGDVPSVTLADVPVGEGPRSFNLSVVLKAQRGGFLDQFIFDPEMIVGETDGEGG